MKSSRILIPVAMLLLVLGFVINGPAPLRYLLFGSSILLLVAHLVRIARGGRHDSTR